MIFLRLFYSFILVGLFSFGGAYAAIPLVRDVAESYGLFSDEFITDLIAVAESTPGPIGVNLATFVGTKVAGIPGGVVATIAEVIPAFLIMLLFSIFFREIVKSPKVKYVLSVIRPCVVGIIMSAGLHMLLQNTGILNLFSVTYERSNTLKALIIVLLLLIILISYEKIKGKSLGTISIIIIGAIFGIAINILV